MSSLPAPGAGVVPDDPGPARSRPAGLAVRRSRVALDVGGFALVTAGTGIVLAVLGAALGLGSRTVGDGTIVATPAQGLWLIVPVAAALGWYQLGTGRERRLGRDSDLVSRFGLSWRIRDPDWSLGVAIGLPVGLLAVELIAGSESGVQRVALAGTGHAAVAAILPAIAVAAAVEATIGEFIFRGYGTAALAGLGPAGGPSARLRSDLLIGVAWWLWSLPLIGVWLSEAAYRGMTSVPRVVFVPLYLVALLAMSVVLGELRRRSGSIWPGVALRTIGGTAAGLLLTGRHLTFAGHFDVLYSPAATSVIAVAGFALAGYLIRRRGSVDRTPAETS